MVTHEARQTQKTLYYPSKRNTKKSCSPELTGWWTARLGVSAGRFYPWCPAVQSTGRQAHDICCFNSTRANSISAAVIFIETGCFVFRRSPPSAPRRFMLMPPEFRASAKTSSCCFKVRERLNSEGNEKIPHRSSHDVIICFDGFHCHVSRKRQKTSLYLEYSQREGCECLTSLLPCGTRANRLIRRKRTASGCVEPL